MRIRNEEQFLRKKIELMEKCFETYAEYGLCAVGIKGLSQACGCSSANLYTYFDDLDDLIVQSTAYCMGKVEDDFMAWAPRNVEELWRFIDEVPYWTAREHGKKYRLMYQVYTHPKYREQGREFFSGVNERYREYAAQLEGLIGIPRETLTGLIFILVRACVHYALFEDEYYLQAQLDVLKRSVALYLPQTGDVHDGGAEG